jgi:hypothetical protein
MKLFKDMVIKDLELVTSRVYSNQLNMSKKKEEISQNSKELSIDK